jgi:hypothetical protein
MSRVWGVCWPLASDWLRPQRSIRNPYLSSYFSVICLSARPQLGIAAHRPRADEVGTRRSRGRRACGWRRSVSTWWPLSPHLSDDLAVFRPRQIRPLSLRSCASVEQRVPCICFQNTRVVGPSKRFSPATNHLCNYTRVECACTTNCTCWNVQEATIW